MDAKGAAATEAYAEAVRATSRQLVVLDNAFSGSSAAATAARAFVSVRRALHDGIRGARYEREIHSAAAELAEVAAWMLFDAERHASARRFNREALRLARSAGDRTIELLILQNVALHAGWAGRAREELAIARSVLDRERLTPRAEAIFRIREANGLFGTGRAREAARSFDRARSLLAEGERGNDPFWAWWVSMDEIDGHEGGRHLDAADWRRAIPYLERAALHEAGARVGYGSIFDAQLLASYLGAGAWSDAERTAETLARAVHGIGSARTFTILKCTARRAAQQERIPPGVRDAVHELAAAVAAAQATR
ncbi:hypothetical protein [Streptomyces sp. 8N616]|uniref:hypothetical protein n=1 Tax=Streptomyces sp. 8N616 TaxID=3457414 RepID=UPI003FD4158D